MCYTQQCEASLQELGNDILCQYDSSCVCVVEYMHVRVLAIESQGCICSYGGCAIHSVQVLPLTAQSQGQMLVLMSSVLLQVCHAVIHLVMAASTFYFRGMLQVS